MDIIIYTDTSHNGKLQIAACGYLVLYGESEIKFEVTMFGCISRTTHAEATAMTLGLKYIIGEMKDSEEIKTVTIKTDALSLVQARKDNNRFPRRLRELIKECALKNLTVIFEYVKGHSTDEYNRRVDIACRKNLREYIKQKEKIVK